MHEPARIRTAHSLKERRAFLLGTQPRLPQDHLRQGWADVATLRRLHAIYPEVGPWLLTQLHAAADAGQLGEAGVSHLMGRDTLDQPGRAAPGAAAPDDRVLATFLLEAAALTERAGVQLARVIVAAEVSQGLPLSAEAAGITVRHHDARRALGRRVETR